MPSLTLAVSPAAPRRGDTVTATYAVIGNEGTPAVPAVPARPSSVHTIAGEVLFDGVPAHVQASITLPGTPEVPEVPAVAPLRQTIHAPLCDSLTFVATSSELVWTAVA